MKTVANHLKNSMSAALKLCLLLVMYGAILDWFDTVEDQTRLRARNEERAAADNLSAAAETLSKSNTSSQEDWTLGSSTSSSLEALPVETPDLDKNGQVLLPFITTLTSVPTSWISHAVRSAETECGGSHIGSHAFVNAPFYAGIFSTVGWIQARRHDFRLEVTSTLPIKEMDFWRYNGEIWNVK